MSKRSGKTKLIRVWTDRKGIEAMNRASQNVGKLPVKRNHGTVLFISRNEEKVLNGLIDQILDFFKEAEPRWTAQDIQFEKNRAEFQRNMTEMEERLARVSKNR
jgi:hypothetical protein